VAANAALKYWRAFALIPKLTEPEQQKLNADCLTMPLDAHARDLVTSAEYPLWLMHQGAAQPVCDWAIDWEGEGIEALLPHMSAARALASLACLRARMRFEQGHTEAAVDDVMAAMTMSRHASTDGSLIAVLVAYNIEGRMGETLALGLPKLNAQAIRDVQRRLAALPAGGGPSTGLRTAEENTIVWFIRKIKKAKDNETLLAFLGHIKLLSLPGQVPDSERTPEAIAQKGRALLEEWGGTADAVIKFAESARPSYELMATKLDLPLDQFAREFERERNKQAANPVFKIFFPALDKLRWAQARMDVRRAILAAALAVQLDGQGALKNHRDPVNGAPFDYASFDKGFELRATWKLDDQLRAKWKLDDRATQPIVLTAGPGK
jgi:hypothetical protein